MISNSLAQALRATILLSMGVVTASDYSTNPLTNLIFRQ